MSRTYIKQIKTEEGSSFELDLAPMLALMVTLIPILLLSTVFVQVVVIESPLPQVVKEAIEEDRKKKEREVLVTLDMGKKSGFALKVNVDGKNTNTYLVPNKAGNLDIKELHKKLAIVKRSHPKVFRLDLFPAADVGYSDIVKVMDSARKLTAEEGKVKIQNSKTNEVAETDLMFPDVVFANVVEG